MRSGVGLLTLFILLRGSDSTLLKLLQRAGEATQAAGGPEAISFCNVFFFSSLITGLALLLSERQMVKHQLPSLNLEDRWLLALQSFSGFFLGPMCFYLALDRLSVVEQTLIFSLTIPVTALLARALLQEALPRSFALSCALISCGLLLANHARFVLNAGIPVDLHGVLWALLGVMAFGFSAVISRVTGSRGLGVGFTVGINSLAAAAAFAVIALLLFGPNHFFYLKSWWVLGVIGGYALVITLGSQWSLMQSYVRLPVAKVTVWSSLTIVVSLAQAHLLLAEELSWMSLVGAALILVAVALEQLASSSSNHADKLKRPTYDS
jgi:drug/metabolite transporter (DMT)-like permease